MPRAGLSTSVVVEAAADLADEIGYDALTLTALASRLNVAVPSLYKHVGSLDDLRRSVALMAVQELGAAMRAALGNGDAATAERDLHAVAAAYHRYALEHPGRYAATVRAAPGGDQELLAASDATVQVVLGVLEAYGLRGDDRIHAARALRAALHGFASLETAGGFGLPQDVERSFQWMVETFEGGLVARNGLPDRPAATDGAGVGDSGPGQAHHEEGKVSSPEPTPGGTDASDPSRSRGRSC